VTIKSNPTVVAMAQLYPDGECQELCAAIADVHKLNPDHICR